jgi:hypothetical protein
MLDLVSDLESMANLVIYYIPWRQHIHRYDIWIDLMCIMVLNLGAYLQYGHVWSAHYRSA